MMSVRGERLRGDATLDDALTQEAGIKGAQDHARKKGVGDATIQSTKKSEQNTDNKLKEETQKDVE